MRFALFLAVSVALAIVMAANGNRWIAFAAAVLIVIAMKSANAGKYQTAI